MIHYLRSLTPLVTVMNAFKDNSINQYYLIRGKPLDTSRYLESNITFKENHVLEVKKLCLSGETRGPFTQLKGMKFSNSIISNIC